MYETGEFGSWRDDPKQRALCFVLIAADVAIWLAASAMVASRGF
jgi:hypothetical protein